MATPTAAAESYVERHVPNTVYYMSYIQKKADNCGKNYIQNHRLEDSDRRKPKK